MSSSRSNFELDPSALADLDAELNVAKASRKIYRLPRVDIEKGHSWKVRVLPVEIGPGKKWYGRVAQHWLGRTGKKAVFCIRNTSPNHGGDPNYECPNCAFVEQYVGHDQKAVSERASECVAAPKWYAICVVLAKDSGQGIVQDVPEPECWEPYELPLYANVWQDIAGCYKRGATRNNPASFTDLYLGFDLWINRTGRGMVIQPQAPCPLVNEDQMEDVTGKIWKKIILPDVTMPTVEEEHEFLLKMQDYIRTGNIQVDPRGGTSGGRAPSRGPSRSAPQPQDYNDDEPTQPAPPSRGPAPRVSPPRTPPAPVAEVEPPQEAPPARTSPPLRRPVEPAPAAVQPPQSQPALTPPPRRLVTPPPLSRVTAPLVTSAPAAHQPPPVVDDPPPLEIEGSATESTEQEIEDNVASEKKDLAPAQPLQEVASAPPPTIPQPAGTTSRLGARLTAQLAKFNK